MITVSGTLTVREITGRYGPFKVGSLLTEIGEFSIKDRVIEELAEGKYRGDFVVAQIKPASYVAAGRLVVEVRALLGDIQLEEDEALAEDEKAVVTESDPIEEEKSASKPSESTEKDNPPAAVPQSVDSTDTQPKSATEARKESLSASESANDCGRLEDIKDVFGELFFDDSGGLKPLTRLKLDPTVDRSLLRRQANMLTNMGYIHNYKQREWVLEDSDKFDKYVSA